MKSSEHENTIHTQHEGQISNPELLLSKMSPQEVLPVEMLPGQEVILQAEGPIAARETGEVSSPSLQRIALSKELVENDFDTFYQVARPMVLRALRGYYLSREDAEDISQEILLKAHLSINSFDATKGIMMTWLAQITQNTAIDFFRRVKRRPQQSILPEETLQILFDNTEDTGVAVEAEIMENWRKEKVDESLTQLRESSPDQHEVIQLTREGKTHSEIAQIVGRPSGTVKTRNRLGLQKLRVMLEDDKDLLID